MIITQTPQNHMQCAHTISGKMKPGLKSPEEWYNNNVLKWRQVIS